MVTVHESHVDIQRGAAYFPKGIVFDTAITTPVLCSTTTSTWLG